MSIPRLLHGEDARVGGGRLDETYLAELEDRSDDLATRRIRELPQSTQSVIESALGGVPERSNGAVSKVADPRTAATTGKTLARKAFRGLDQPGAFWTFGSGEATGGQRGDPEVSLNRHPYNRPAYASWIPKTSNSDPTTSDLPRYEGAELR